MKPFRKNHSPRTLTPRHDDPQRLVRLAESRGWRIEIENADTLLRSPTGKYGDWAEIRISLRPDQARRRTSVQTKRSGISRAFRGLWMADMMLQEGEQWRFAASTPKTPQPAP